MLTRQGGIRDSFCNFADMSDVFGGPLFLLYIYVYIYMVFGGPASSSYIYRESEKEREI
jgi:hypothetical protein